MAEETVQNVIDTMNASQKEAMYALLSMIELPEEEIAHHGVKGMRWGVRHDEKGGGRSGSKKKISGVKKMASFAAKAKKRIQKKISEIPPEDIERGKRYAKAALAIVGTVALSKFVGANITESTTHNIHMTQYSPIRTLTYD